MQQIKDLGLELKYTLNTHLHADHITGSGQLKLRSANAKSVISIHSGAQADIHIDEFDFVEFGSWRVYAVATPGHTDVSREETPLFPFSQMFFRDAFLMS